MTNIWVRQAREEDAANFTNWFVTMPSFTSDVLKYPSYTLCAFSNKVLAYGVVNFAEDIQVLSRVVVNPEASVLEQAGASKEIVQAVITIGYLNQRKEIYFVGDHKGTNRIAEHIFKQVPYEDYKHVFDSSEFPVYRLRLEELENGR